MKHDTHILVIDDEPAFVRICKGWLSEQGYHVSTADSAESAKAQYAQTEFDLVLLDLAMPPSMSPEEGLSLLPEFRKTPVIILTGHAQRDLALRAIEAGAWDFLAKPLDPAMFRIVIQRAAEKQSLEKEIQQLREKLSKANQDDFGLIGRSAGIYRVRDLISRIAPSNVNVVISGPSGTGKERVAQAIHRFSERSSGPFVPVNCGGINENLLESEFFGHVKGSFTGAVADRVGLVASADGGTLFLDEVGDMPAAMQVKLLRFLQERTFTPVGSDKPLASNVRVVSATHRNLAKMIESGEFREDLYYRIKGMEIAISSLAERIEDIPLLASHFLSKHDPSHEKSLSSDAIGWLVKQTWTGNVRELENRIETTVALAGDERVLVKNAFLMDFSPQIPDCGDPSSLDQQLATLEKRLIVTALEECKQNRTQTAQQLGISRAGLLKKMTRHKLR